jgi:hypothetical protein
MFYKNILLEVEAPEFIIVSGFLKWNRLILGMLAAPRATPHNSATSRGPRLCN